MKNPTPTTSHFDRSARDWDQRPMSQQLAVVAERLLSRLTLNSDQHWLDFGAGTGLLSLPLAQQVAQVTALDTSAAMLAVLAEKGQTNIQTLQQDVFAGLPAVYAGVVSCMALHHVEDTLGLLRIFHQHLQPAGQLALVDLYAEDGSFHGDNEGKGVKHLGFEPAELQALAEQAGFQAVTFTEILHLQHRNGRDYPLFLMQARASG
ncbi:class I SAM-dependent methyltransferase [Marinospirillum alkaliphilum]|nr:class I SAM-dependent methyltransferase [Marinospirillum alkaliphilum]